MINGAIHQLSPSLMESLHSYRSQIDAGRTPDTSQPEPSQSSVVSLSEKVSPTLDLDELKAVSQDNRDTARKVAVHAFDIKNTKTMADTLLEGLSGSNNNDVNTQTIDPSEAYQASMKYARRDDLISASETLQSQDGEGRLEINPLIPLDSQDMSLLEKPGSQLNMDELKSASHENRDTARKVAVQAFEIQHTKSMVDTYINASSDDDDGINTLTADPAEAASTSRKYTRQESLISAFEKAAIGESSGSQLNIVV